jgi:hypothetical protein
MVFSTTERAVMTAMIEATPATMPTSVRIDRSLLVTSEWVDMRKRSRTFMRAPFRSGRLAAR